MRARLDQEKAQAFAQAQAAQQQWHALAQQTLNQVEAIVANLPEFQGARNLDEIKGRFAMLPEARQQQIQGIILRAQAATQQAAAYQQQVAVAQAQQQQAEFQNWAAAEDQAYSKATNYTPEQRYKIGVDVKAMFEELGISEAQLAAEYNSNRLLRSAAGQQMLTKLAEDRIKARTPAPRPAAKSVPPVQRRGTVDRYVSGDERYANAKVAEALRSFNENTNDVRAAARVLAARRAARH